jgi:protein TonB
MTQLSFPQSTGPEGRDPFTPFAFAEAIRTPRSAASTWTAVGAHALAILLLLGFAAGVQRANPPLRIPPALSLSDPQLPPLQHISPGSDAGRGANSDAALAQQGHPPRAADITLLPNAAPPKITPILAVAPSVDMPNMTTPNSPLPNLGITDSTLHNGSLGIGNNRGVGDTTGPGSGHSADGIGLDGVKHMGTAGVSAPVLTYSVQPEFSEDARKSKFSGNVQVYVIVDEQGRPTHVRIARGVGMGLDEKAVEAVRQYKFKPAMQNGKPVKVDLYIDVNFLIF